MYIINGEEQSNKINSILFTHIEMIFKFEPIALEKVWGGTKLSEMYKKNIKRIGEIWGISAHKSKTNIISHGVYKGMTFRELYDNHRDLFGGLKANEFPLLFKIIDAKDDLSIQVHPDDAYAKMHEGAYGKDEYWYILDTDDQDAKIILGHKATTKEHLKSYISENRIQELVNTVLIAPKDYFFVPAGTIHAICKGTTLLEVSQSSDVTYRVYDYNRRDKGKLRELHIEQALDVIKVPNINVSEPHDAKMFTFKVIKNDQENLRTAHPFGDYIYMIAGSGILNDEAVNAGEFVMISSNAGYTLNGHFEYALITIKH